MRHGLGRSLLVLAIFGTAFLLLHKFLSGPDGLSLTRMISRVHAQVPKGSSRVSDQEGETVTLAPLRNGKRALNILEQIDLATEELVESVMPSVVRIDTKTRMSIPRRELTPENQTIEEQPFDQPGLGSGVIVSKEGHIVTNYHVVEGADVIEVRTSDGAMLLGTRIGAVADMDVAVLKIANPSGREFQPLPFGDSDEVKPGHFVVAIGSPLGLTKTVSRGIISARQRQVDETDVPLFQTTTIINPGSSGGPLINSRGELVAINSAIVSGDQALTGWQGVGLAIPSNDVQYVFYRIMRKGHELGYLGISANDVQAAPDTKFGARPETAVIVTDVTKNSPAEAGGVLPDDVVRSFNGRSIRTTNQLFALVGKHPVGEAAEMVVFRDGAEIPLTVVIASRTKALRQQRTLGDFGQVGAVREVGDFSQLIGVEVGDFTPAMRRQFGIFANSPGILVTYVAKTSQLYGRLQKGDVIERLNDSIIYWAHDFHNQINRIEPGVHITLHFKRKGEDKTVSFKRVD